MSKINPALVDELFQQGHITEQTRRASQTYLNGPLAWRKWTDRLLLTLGTSLILSSVLFFFAYNWESMDKWFKFVLLEGGIILCLIGALYNFKSRTINETLIFSASLLLGVLLALIGQTYQTGADPWQLFALWALLITPWVCLSKFAPHWLLWLVVLNFALSLWMEQTLALPSKNEAMLIYLALSLLNASALGALLYARLQNITWLQSPWLLRLLNLATIACLASTFLIYLFQSRSQTNFALIAALMTLAAQALLFYLSRDKWHDFIAHATVVIALAIQAEGIIIKFTETSMKSHTGVWFIATLATLIFFTNLVAYLRTVHKSLEGQS